MTDSESKSPEPRPDFGPTEISIRNMILPLGIASPDLTTVQLVRSLLEHYREAKRYIPLPLQHGEFNAATAFPDRVPKSDGALLDELKREKADALSVMLGGLPIERQDLRDGVLGNITRFYVSAFKRLLRAEKERESAIADSNRLRQEANEATAAKRRVAQDLADAHEQIKRMNIKHPQSMGESPAETPEVTDVPDAFVALSMEALDRFAEGYREYGEGAADALGLAGQWGDLHRKVMKLKSSLWTGKANLTRETEEDILYDIIGHCLLALEMMARDFTGGRD